MNSVYELRSRGYVEIDDEIWFPNLNFNALIKMGKGSGRIQIMGKFPNYSIHEKELYSAVCLVEGQLIFVPFNSREIVIYHLKTEEFTSHPLDKRHNERGTNFFLSAYAYGNYVYMFPMCAKYIVKYDVLKKSILYISNTFLDSLPEMMPRFIQAFEIMDEKIYIPFAEVPAIAVLNMRNDSLDVKYLNISGGCTTINYCKEYFYLASSKTPEIYRWKMETNEIKVYDDFPKEYMQKDYDAKEYIFLGTYYQKNRIFFFPDLGNVLLSFDIETEKISLERARYNINTDCPITYIVKENKVLMDEMENVYCINIEGERMQLKPWFKVDREYNQKHIRSFLLINGYYDFSYETDDAIDEYIRVLLQMDRHAVAEKNRNYGEKIFKNIWNSL